MLKSRDSCADVCEDTISRAGKAAEKVSTAEERGNVEGNEHRCKHRAIDRDKWDALHTAR